MEPEGPQEEVSVTPEPQPEPEAEVEPEPAAVELKPEPVSEPEVHIEEKIQRSPPSPTPADTAPAMPEDNRVRPLSVGSLSLCIFEDVQSSQTGLVSSPVKSNAFFCFSRLRGLQSLARISHQEEWSPSRESLHMLSESHLRR